MSNETIKLFGWERFKLLSLSTKLKEPGTEWVVNFSNTGSKTEIKKVDKFDGGDII